MNYFVTGATGFIGRFLVPALLARGGVVHALVRAGSEEKLAALRAQLGASEQQLVAVSGDLTQPALGLSADALAQLRGNTRHFFHLAAIYDLKADAASQELTNIRGTQHALDAAAQMQAGCFHLVSSIAAAGLYRGTFREDMFEEAERLEHPYFRTKHESEKLVRTRCSVPYRIYRPGMVVGHSKTGEIDKIDGPYYFFKLIQKLRDVFPRWMPMPGVEGGRFNIVPVDYVVAAMDHLAHQPDLDSRCFHLTDEQSYRIGDVMNIFARAAHAPSFDMRIDTRMLSFIPLPLRNGLGRLPPVQRITEQVLKNLDIPRESLQFLSYGTKFDNRETRKALHDSGIRCPSLPDYAWVLWDYWERHLDPDLFVDRSLESRLRNKIVLLTGASSGIGHATALRLAEAGGHLLLVARDIAKLEATANEVRQHGGKAEVYSCDVSDMAQCDELIKKVMAEHGRVDILINNAGRSIRRSVANAVERFHDYERTMQLNYFGALRLIMGVVPAMREQHRGHVINISSIGVLSNAPRFSAYVASKAALDAFSRCASSEFSDEGIAFTTINMPLVRTPMIAPTKIYDYAPAITPEEAAGMIAQAIVERPKRIATRLGIFAQVAHTIAPKTSEIVLNAGFRMFPDSAAAQGKGEAPVTMSTEQMAFTYLLKGIHW